MAGGERKYEIQEVLSRAFDAAQEMIRVDATVNFEGDTSDLDSGAGTDNHAVVAIGVPASGGHFTITGDAAGLDVDTELPAAVALADNAANPTAPAVGAFLMGHDGATWDKLRTWDGFTGAGNALMVVPALSNGTTLDSPRNNAESTALASAARTATVNSSDLTNYNGRGCHVVIDVTAIVATPSLVVKIQGKDALSGKYYDILVATAITATGTTVLKVYPGITPTAGASASDMLPRTFRVRVEHADADSATYSVGVTVNL